MITREIKKAWRYFRSLPKTIYFNFKYLDFKQAMRMPIWVSHSVVLDTMKGTVIVDRPITGMVQIGFDRSGLFDESARSVWQVSGVVRFKGTARIAPASKLIVSGHITFGENFISSGGAAFFCANEISFGDDNMLSWGITVMDHDSHEIRDTSNNLINPPKPIHFGDKIWVGCDVTILKGSGCDDGCVIATGTLLSKKISGVNQIIGGNPPRALKQDIRWQL